MSGNNNEENPESSDATCENNISHNISSSLNLTTTAPHLEVLEQTDQLYIVRQPDSLSFPTEIPTRSYFKVFNHQGRHIYSVCQTDPPFRERKFVMYVFPVRGPSPSTSLTTTTDYGGQDEPFLKIVQRCPERPEEIDKAEMLPYLKFDQELKTLNTKNNQQGRMIKLKPYGEARARAHIHIQHLEIDPAQEDSSMLGHIWRGKEDFKIYNANLQQMFTFPKILHKKLTSVDIDYSARKRLGLCSSKWTFYDYFHESKSDAVLPQIPVGRVEFNVRTTAALAPETTNKQNCSSCSFPMDLSNVDKCLVFAFTLSMYCRTKSKSEKLRERCLFIIFGMTSLVVIIIITGGLLCELDSDVKCKVFNF